MNIVSPPVANYFDLLRGLTLQLAGLPRRDRQLSIRSGRPLDTRGV